MQQKMVKKSWAGRVRPDRRMMLVVAALLAVTGCQTEQINPFEPRKLGDPQRQAAQNQSTFDRGPLPTTYKSWEVRSRRTADESEAVRPARSVRRGGSTRPIIIGTESRTMMPLADVIRRTVVNSLDVKAAGFAPAIEATRILEAQARFDPTFFGNAGADISNRQTAGTPFTDPRTVGTIQQRTTILDRQKQVQYTAVSGVRQVLEGGGQIEARYQLRSTDGDPNSFVTDPYREAELVLQLTQPLLRDFGGQVNRARIDIARNTSRVSLLDFRNAVEEAVANVEQAYWQLAAAQRDVEIQTERVRGAVETADILAARLSNDASRLQLSQAQAEAETRRTALFRANTRVRDLSDQIKQLMNDPTLASSSETVLVADTTPHDQLVRFDLEELIDTALQYRVELAQQQLRIDNATVTLGAAKNNLLPSLNFVGSVTPSGLGEKFDSAISSQSDFNKISYSLGLQLEIPIGNREARAIYRRSQLQRSQAITQYQSLQEQVARDVQLQHREVQASYNDITQARLSRQAREQAMRAILSQEGADEPLTPQFVDLKLRTQDFLAQAKSDENTALATYNIAISRLERSKGTLLRYNNISLDEKGMRRQLSR